MRIRTDQSITQKGRFRGSGLVVKRIAAGLRRQSGPGPGLDQRNIGAVDQPVDRDVFAEVGGSPTSCPDCDWVCEMSLELTARLAVVSPVRKDLLKWLERIRGFKKKLR
jgi:hypothetical protein